MSRPSAQGASDLPGAASDAPALGDGAVPRHVAIIMDGNGRWAQRRGLPRAAGHKAGGEAVRATLKAAVKAGVECLTLYAFSSENWRRSEEEVSDLKGLMRYYLERELDQLAREGVRLDYIGDPSKFGPDLWQRLEKAREATRHNERLHLVIALNYGSRAEIAEAARTLAQDVAEGRRDPASIDEDALAANMQTASLPELDLVIRTSGEERLSNFLLWQAAYAELMFVDTLWPDFGEEQFFDAIRAFGQRQRRFGGR